MWGRREWPSGAGNPFRAGGTVGSRGSENVGLAPANAPLRRSLALGPLLDHLASGRSNQVLDLGPAVGSNLERLARLGCRVRVLDAQRAFAAGETPAPELAEDSLDAVLAWDVLDYLTPAEIRPLMERLAPACGRRGLLLLLLSTAGNIPASPPRYRIVDRETLACEGPLEPQRRSPRRTQAELARLLPGFAVRTSYLLRHGVREYLLASQEAPGVSPLGTKPLRPNPALPERWWFRRV